MAFSWIDWAIVGVFLLFLTGMALYANRYTKSVADFLSANRVAGRYLISVAAGLAGVAAISIIANFQKYYKSGFGGAYWTEFVWIVIIIIALSGWVVYPFRQTRALTMAQFLEMRYSRRFRIFAGIMAWISGVLNYGVFPSVTARFFIYFCDIPEKIVPMGPFEVNVTLGMIMFVILSFGVFFTISGGQITVMITDFLQGQFTNIVMAVISIYLLTRFSWSEIFTALSEGAGDGKSLINPFEQGSIEGFSPAFFFMWAFMRFYTHRIWQGSQGYNSAAKSPHEAKIANILGALRGQVSKLLMLIIPICAFTLLHSNVYPEATANANEAIQSLPGEWERAIGTVVIAVKELLPTGLLGLLAATMLAAAISTDDTALHSWGSIFIQDVVLPFRKKHLPPKLHLKMLRWSCFGVAVFAWIFSMVFPLRDFIFMYFAITGAIFLGGAGIAVIGGLYWQRGTTPGAWAGMVVGVILGTTGMLTRNVLWKPLLPQLQNVLPQWLWLQNQDPLKFPLDGMEMGFGTAVIATVVYITVSLMTKPKPGFSLDKMRHRGKYAIEGEYVARSKRNKYLARLGLNEEFSKFDKFIWFFNLVWFFSWWVIMVTVAILWYYDIWKESWFPLFWIIKVWSMVALAIFVAIWFLFGGFRDMFRLFKTLNTMQRDEYDDGVVYDETSESSNESTG